MNVFGVMTQRNIAASASVAQYESFAVQIKGSQSFPSVFCCCSLPLLRLKSRDINLVIISWPYTIYGAWGSVVVKTLRYQSDGLAIDSGWCHWGFFPQLPTEPCALVSTQPLKMSTRDFFWSKGGRCVRLTTYHPRSAERKENPGP